MAIQTILVIDHPATAADAAELLIDDNTQSSGLKLQRFIKNVVCGVDGGQVFTGVGAAKASGTLTLASVVATKTATINGVTFTAIASGATGNQFNVGADDTATAVNLAAAINASASALVSEHVIATSAAAVVTVTAKRPGAAGNAVTIAGGDATITASGARLTGGTDGASTSTFNYGSQ